ncbi:mucoidy inhibitor MuiA family protein [Antrihabitans sp. YC2-6]|uniref:mucoidy inhibitor MuiA family protein n=1 Tax=Antrihabitans sp. YC2-6 TaxID=2799498 RepID=UPI0018F369D6|nr:mucoidy inhibitor MuiA family protein [Antrihabitans sp. YC2-6]MBJ8344846.1 mucoidy inhibitor MuiA family protein [Antrihabitans sp. YC2-6]
MTSAELLLEAPIVAVTVYPHGARITRRGTVTVPSGDAHVVLDDLAFGLDPGTVRVTGRGSATVLGVDVVFRHHAESPESAVAALIVRKKEIIERSREISDAIEVQDARQRFLDELSSHAGASFAKQIAAGRAEYPTAFAETIATQHSAVRSEKRSLTAAAEGVQDELAAIEREIAARAEYRPDRRAVQIATAAAAAATIEFDVSYVVGGAGWTSVYDLRQTGERLNVTWYGVVSQQTGEDWPECDLALSTAQVSRSLTVPELAPLVPRPEAASAAGRRGEIRRRIRCRARTDDGVVG